MDEWGWASADVVREVLTEGTSVNLYALVTACFFSFFLFFSSLSPSSFSSTICLKGMTQSLPRPWCLFSFCGKIHVICLKIPKQAPDKKEVSFFCISVLLSVTGSLFATLIAKTNQISFKIMKKRPFISISLILGSLLLHTTGYFCSLNTVVPVSEIKALLISWVKHWESH